MPTASPPTAPRPSGRASTSRPSQHKPSDRSTLTDRTSRSPTRLGPRPLPLHLMSAATLWLSSGTALPFLKSGWPGSKPEIAARAAELAGRLDDIAADRFADAVDREVRVQADAFLIGLDRYRRHPYRRDLPEPAVVWQDGTTRLLDYAPSSRAGLAESGGGTPVLVVPSLVNRFYILDLAEGRSLLRHLAGAGLRPLVVDWGRPGEAERGFDLTAYIAGRLEAALDASLDLTGARPIVLGYCMGGLLALALARRRPRDLRGLALLATPWDFHADQGAQARLAGSLADTIAAVCAPLGEVPVDLLQGFFTAVDPLLALKKFTRLAALQAGSPAARDFVALEDWLNDGVPLALPTACETLDGWYRENRPGRGTWRVAGRIVDPRQCRLPALVVVPARDRIVPPASASALADLLPHAERLSPPLGHVGMIVGSRARSECWAGLTDWLLRQAPEPARTSQAR